MSKSFKIISAVVGGTLAAAALIGGVAISQASPGSNEPPHTVTIAQSNSPLGW